MVLVTPLCTGSLQLRPTISAPSDIDTPLHSVAIHRTSSGGTVLRVGGMRGVGCSYAYSMWFWGVYVTLMPNMLRTARQHVFSKAW
jgi:hypothetical protein